MQRTDRAQCPTCKGKHAEWWVKRAAIDATGKAEIWGGKGAGHDTVVGLRCLACGTAWDRDAEPE